VGDPIDPEEAGSGQPATELPAAGLDDDLPSAESGEEPSQSADEEASELPT
jgi:hypothetical protein